MKNNVEEFLTAYKVFETICRQKGKEVKEFEESLGETNPKVQKIRIIRQLRNFCSHNEYNDFIQIHKGMIKFLKDEIKLSKQKENKQKENKKNNKTYTKKKPIIKRYTKTKKKK